MSNRFISFILLANRVRDMLSRLGFAAEHTLASMVGAPPCTVCQRDHIALRRVHGQLFMPRRLCHDCLDRLTDTPLTGLIVLTDSPTNPLCIRYFSATNYDGQLRHMIHQVKYERDQMLALDLPPLLIKALILALDSEQTNLLVPVPLHPDKHRERGFNQCAVLARGLHKLATISGIKLKLDIDLLQRTVYTRPQKGLKASERRANVAGAFKARRNLHGEHIILLDDVLTSGATISTCARVLLQSGAARVSALTLGRAVWRDIDPATVPALFDISSAPLAETSEQHGTVSHLS